MYFGVSVGIVYIEIYYCSVDEVLCDVDVVMY